MALYLFIYEYKIGLIWFLIYYDSDKVKIAI